jgi:LemA protein
MVAIFLGLIFLVLAWLIVIYNNLVRLRNMSKEGWSGIEVQLKRRADLIPNVVEAVKGYMGHERNLLSKVTELRAKSQSAREIGDKSRLEGELSRALANVFAVAEGYPDLKANQNFLDLQSQLGKIEEEIQLARRYYNEPCGSLILRSSRFREHGSRIFQVYPAEFLKSKIRLIRQYWNYAFSRPC